MKDLHVPPRLRVGLVSQGYDQGRAAQLSATHGKRGAIDLRQFQA
jgi:hypothetical protein